MPFKSFNIPDHKINIIGISGKKDIGKRACAEFIQEYIEKKIGATVIKIAFADQIKQTLLNLFTPFVTLDYLTIHKDKKIPELDTTGRRLMQGFGEYCKIIHPKVWIDYIFKRRLHGYFYIIHDVRYPDEAQAVLDNKGLLIRLNGGDSDDTHSTETALDDFDFPVIIENSEYVNKDIEYLLDKTDI